MSAHNNPQYISNPSLFTGLQERRPRPPPPPRPVLPGRLLHLRNAVGFPGDLPVLVPGGPGGHQAPDGGQPGRGHRGGGAGHRVLEVDRGWAGARGGDCRGVGGLRRQAARVSAWGMIYDCSTIISTC